MPGGEKGGRVAEKPVAVCPATADPRDVRLHHNPHLYPKPTRRHLEALVSPPLNLSCGTKRHGGGRSFGRSSHCTEGEGGTTARERKTESSHRQHEIESIGVGEWFRPRRARGDDGRYCTGMVKLSSLITSHRWADDSARRRKCARELIMGWGRRREQRSPPDSRGRGGRDGPGAAGSRLLARLAVPDSDGSTLDRVLAAEGAPRAGWAWDQHLPPGLTPS